MHTDYADRRRNIFNPRAKNLFAVFPKGTSANFAVNQKILPFFEDEKCCQHDKREAHEVIPGEFLFQVEN